MLVIEAFTKNKEFVLLEDVDGVENLFVADKRVRIWSPLLPYRKKICVQKDCDYTQIPKEYNHNPRYATHSEVMKDYQLN